MSPRRSIMASKKTQYVLPPSEGMTVSAENHNQMRLFQDLHSARLATSVHTLATETKPVAVNVVDSIGETKAKLIEMAPEDLPAFRGANPSVRVMPLVFYKPAVLRYEVLSTVTTAGRRAAVRGGVGAKAVKAT